MALLGNGAPAIQTGLASQTVAWGGAARFIATATGACSLSYQWQLNGTNIDGATNAWLILSNILGNQAGAYTVVVSNSLGTATSAAGPLAIQPRFATSQLSLSNGQFHLVAGGTQGAPFILETSSDLTNWVPAQTNTFPADGLPLTLPAADNHQFFRIKAPANP